MPRVPSSRPGCYRIPRLRAYHVLSPQSSRRRPQAPQTRLPHHQSPLRPVTDASTSTDDLGAQETGAEENIVAIPEDAVAANTPESETCESVAHFITMRKMGSSNEYHCQMESHSVASSGERLLRSVPEDSLVLDPERTTSVSFALVDGDPFAATKRVMNRLRRGPDLVDEEVGMQVQHWLDRSTKLFWLYNYGYDVDSTPTV